jgi:MtN3 and saliva related transmembrane protein
MLSNPALIGYTAAVCTSVAFLPQVLHTLRTRDTAGISLGMYLIFCTGVALWLVYGLLIGDMPVIAANVVTLTLSLAVLALKVRNG